MSAVRVRFAPSPTGPLHIGGARSALFNWLFARRHGGTFIVRVEDTDLERSSRQSEEDILAALRWLGLDWDEGVQVGGPKGPYRQTERLDIYRRHAGFLLNSGKAYHCYCTDEELAAEREGLLQKGEMPRYLGRCCNLDPDAAAKLAAAGRKAAVRFKVPKDRVVVVKDMIRGDVSFECSGIGDFIIVKSDGVPTYNFAVVADDHTMEISHVIRAEEHLSNTPRQILLFEALGWPAPRFAHVSLILGSDRSKMSKRHGATAVGQYREKGYLPEALVNFLALLGWSPGGEEEILTVEELITQFSLERVSKSPAVFDLEKLNWLNGHYIRQSPVEAVTDLAVPYLDRAGYFRELLAGDRFSWIDDLDMDVLNDGQEPGLREFSRDQAWLGNFTGYAGRYLDTELFSAGMLDEGLVKRFLWLQMVVSSVREYLSFMEEIIGHVDLFFAGRAVAEEEEARQVLAGPQAPAVLEALCGKIAGVNALDPAGAKTALKNTGKMLGLKGRQVFMPVRVALTGTTHGPELDRIMAALGRDEVIRRLKAALPPG